MFLFILDHQISLKSAAKPMEVGLKLNFLTHKGFIFSRMQETVDRIFWKCTLCTSNKCDAIYVTNKMLRTLDNTRNNHSHDKSAYELFKRRIQQTRKR